MTTPMFPVTAAMEVWLMVNGQRFELTGIEVTFVSQNVSRAMAHLAVGQQASRNGGTGAQAIRYLAGTPAQIYATFASTVADPVSGSILFTAGQHTLFDGVYDDSGPGGLSQGQFSLWIALVSKLAQLNTGSLQYAKLLPNSYVDSTVPPDTESYNGTTGTFNSADIQKDLLGAFKKVFLSIATASVPTSARVGLQQFIKIFGDSVNTPAIPIINALAGSLVGPVTQNTIVAGSIQKYLNMLFTYDAQYQSFFQRLIEMGQEFKFRVMEHPLGLAVVPYSPFFSKPGIVVAPSTIHNMTWANQQPNNSLGTLFTYSGGSVLKNGHVDNLVIGAFKRTAFQSPMGVVTCLPCPWWMVQHGAVHPGDPTQIALPATDAAALVGNGYAEETTYEYAYMGRSVRMTCPLRLDIGLLAAVQIDYPKIPGVDIGSSIYGSVQAVTLSIDAATRQASTVYEIGYVRSQYQQEQEFGAYKHPLWTGAYLGTRLDHAPLA